MTLATIKDEIEQWDTEQQDRLAATVRGNARSGGPAFTVHRTPVGMKGNTP